MSAAVIVYSGKVRDIYDAGDGLLADGRVGPDLGLRRRLRRAGARQGPGADGDDGVLGRGARATSPAPTSCRRDPGRLSREALERSPTSPAGRCSCARPRCCRSSASSAATSPARPGRSTARRAPCTAPAAAGLARVERLARAGLHAVDEGDRRPRREHLLRGRGDLRRQPTSPSRAREICLTAYERGAARAARARDRHRRHEVRARLHRRRAGDLRRDPDARLEPLLAGRRRGSPGRRRRRSTSSPCATGRRAPAGTRRRRRRRCRRGHRRDDETLRRRLRADLRAVASPSGGECRVEVLRHRRGPRPRRHRRPGGPDDRAGPAALGFAGIEHVRVGKVFRFALDAADDGRCSRPGRAAVRPAARQPGDRAVAVTIEPSVAGARRGGPGRTAAAPAARDSRDRRHRLPRLELRARRRRGARGLGADAELVWHTEHRSTASTPSSLPGGFAHGDYLRPGAIARFSPVMAAVCELAAAAGPVLGICNGFQVLTEAGLLPGALQPNAGLRFLCDTVECEVVSTARCSRGG